MTPLGKPEVKKKRGSSRCTDIRSWQANLEAPRVSDYALALARKPPSTLAAIRRCITEGLEAPFEEGLQIEFEAAVELAGHRNFTEGVNAFLAKRAPTWE